MNKINIVITAEDVDELIEKKVTAAVGSIAEEVKDKMKMSIEKWCREHPLDRFAKDAIRIEVGNFVREAMDYDTTENVSAVINKVLEEQVAAELVRAYLRTPAEKKRLRETLLEKIDAETLLKAISLTEKGETK